MNDEIFMSLKEDGRVVAYSSLMPLDEMALQALVEDKFRERDIPLSAILSTVTTCGFEGLKLQGQQTIEGSLVATRRFG